MSKIGLIIGREYWTRVKKKSFIVMTLLAPLIFVVFYAVIVALAIQEPDHIKIEVVDESQQIASQLPESNGSIEWVLKEPSNYASAVKNFKADNSEQKNDILVWIPSNVVQTKGDDPMRALVVYRNSISASTESNIRSAISNARESYKLKTGTIDRVAYDDISASVGVKLFNAEKIDDSGKVKEVQADYKAAGVIGMICSFLIFMFIFMYGAQVMRGVIEEKTNRIIEVIISSVKPFELMMGKVIGVALVGLTQFVMWVVLSGILMTVALAVIGSVTGMDMDMAEMSQMDPSSQVDMGFIGDIAIAIMSLPWLSILVAFIVFFLGGYLLYAAMFAAIGSAVDNEADTQQFMFPIMLPLLLGFYIAQFSIFTNPDGLLMQIASYIPFTSPVVMLMRIAMDTVTWWEVLISLSILIGTFVLFTWMAAKIYRTGILMYGKKATIKEMINWVRR